MNDLIGKCPGDLQVLTRYVEEAQNVPHGHNIRSDCHHAAEVLLMLAEKYHCV